MIAALNDGDEPAGPISYTPIYSYIDEVIVPATTSRLDGGTNIAVQDVCLGRVVTTWLGRLRGLNRGVLMALRNSIRRPARFVLSVGLLASAGSLFVAGLSTLASVQAVPEQAKDQRHWDVEVSITSTTSTDEVTSIAARVPHVSGVEAWTISGTGVAEPGQISITRTYPDQGHGSLAVTAVPAGTTSPTRSNAPSPMRRSR